MKGTRMWSVLVLALGLRVWSVSVAEGTQYLTVNGQDVNSITLELGQSCSVEVVSDDSNPYKANVGFDDCHVMLGTFAHVETRPEAGNLASVADSGVPPFVCYQIVADGSAPAPSAGVHFVFEYVALELGETDLKLYDGTFTSVIDSVHIEVVSGLMGTGFTFQGRLLDAESEAEGLYDFSFGLYDSPSDGNQLGLTVYIDDRDVSGGYFTAELDFGCHILNPNDEARWLEIGVRAGELADPNEYEILRPRQELTPTPYALYAQQAGSDHDWSISEDGNDMYSWRRGNVGVGQSSPRAKLHIRNNTDSVDSFRVDDEYGYRPFIIDESGNVSIGFSDTGTARLAVIGNVGIGTLEPSARLVVGGTGTTRFRIGYKGSYNNVESGRLVFDEDVDADLCGFEFHHDGSENKLHLSAGCPTMNTIVTFTRMGSVGIGTSSPAIGYRLDVEGKIQATAFDAGDITFRSQQTQEILWRMFEDEEGLYLENVKTGKIYGFVLQEMTNGHRAKETVNLDQAIQDLRVENESLKERIEALEGIIGQQLLVSKEVQQ